MWRLHDIVDSEGVWIKVAPEPKKNGQTSFRESNSMQFWRFHYLKLLKKSFTLHFVTLSGDRRGVCHLHPTQKFRFDRAETRQSDFHGVSHKHVRLLNDFNGQFKEDIWVYKISLNVRELVKINAHNLENRCWVKFQGESEFRQGYLSSFLAVFQDFQDFQLADDNFQVIFPWGRRVLLGRSLVGEFGQNISDILIWPGLTLARLVRLNGSNS